MKIENKEKQKNYYITMKIVCVYTYDILHII